MTAIICAAVVLVHKANFTWKIQEKNIDFLKDDSHYTRLGQLEVEVEKLKSIGESETKRLKGKRA